MQVTQDTQPRPEHPYLRTGYIITDVFWDLRQEKQRDPRVPAHDTLSYAQLPHPSHSTLFSNFIFY